MVDLKQYYCELPFTYTELHTDKQTLCCPYWNTTNIQISENFLDNWFGEPAVEIRESMLDGSFKNCSTEYCPSLNTLVKTGAVTGLVIGSTNITYIITNNIGCTAIATLTLKVEKLENKS